MLSTVRTNVFTNTLNEDISDAREKVRNEGVWLTPEESAAQKAGGGYSSSTYYDGYMPWNSTAVAYWMYYDYWDGKSYPVVLSFS